MKNIIHKNIERLDYRHFGLKYLFCIYCLMILPFDLLPFIKGTASAGTEDLVEYEMPRESLAVSTETTKQLKYELWKSDIAPSKKGKEQNYSSELNRLIEQIRSIEIGSQQSSGTKTIPETFPTIEPNHVSIKMSIPKEDAEDKRENESGSSYKSITNATIKTLKGLIQNPEKIKNPFETGEILFINGYMKEAALFYDEALIRTDPNASCSLTDRSWLLFQKGNCLRNDEMAEAGKIYNQLIMEYPDSLWADMAQIQSQFISWYQTEKPQTIIDEHK